MAEEFDGETRWPSDVHPSCCNKKMVPTTHQELLQCGEPCFIMEWTCMKCRCTRDVIECTVWATAYTLAANPIMEKAFELYALRCKNK